MELARVSCHVSGTQKLDSHPVQALTHGSHGDNEVCLISPDSGEVKSDNPKHGHPQRTAADTASHWALSAEHVGEFFIY